MRPVPNVAPVASSVGASLGYWAQYGRGGALARDDHGRRSAERRPAVLLPWKARTAEPEKKFTTPPAQNLAGLLCYLALAERVVYRRK